MAQHNTLGKNGEQIAKDFLEQQGFEILDENWCFGKAEVDIIAFKHKIIIFIEVKTRSGNAFGEPEDFVDVKKQRLLTDAAEEYVYLMNHKGEIRFDIISILFDKNLEKYTLKHIEDAFWNYE
ncbi:YraN family protein [Pedobacter glucosidilyticus]|uniref:YraN family protein n=1 Tax=Pedobacter glucosidilyticus TaxID=1122941 RepID=UPI0026ED76AD|nr:YraN family protein [Pedobacter glucosidilyticus]